MAIEVVNYDFSDHPDQFQHYFKKIMKLIIISKLNCIGTNQSSVDYFVRLVNRISGCNHHYIRYGRLMLFTKFMGHEFNYHTVNVSLKILENNVLELSIESIIQDFVKIFDTLSSDTREIYWNITEKIVNEASSSESESESQSSEKHEIKNNQVENNQTKRTDYEAITFSLLESFINALYFLMNLSMKDKSSLMNIYVEIKDISLTRRILTVEVMVDDEIVIIDLNPKTKDKVSITLDDDKYTGKAIKSLMIQNNFK